MTAVSLSIEDLDPERFSPFGTLLAISPLPPRRPAVCFDAIDLPVGDPIARVVLVESHPAPFALDRVERHHHVAQTFIALAPLEALFVVAPPSLGDGPDPAAFRCFRWTGDHVVQLSRGCWHTLGSPFPSGGGAARYAMITSAPTDDELQAHDLSGAATQLTDIVALVGTSGPLITLKR